MVPFILFIHQFLHVLLPRVFDPFIIYNHFPWCSLQFNPVISCLSLTICFAIRKISFWHLESFKSFAHSCFFSFAEEITLFASVWPTTTWPVKHILYMHILNNDNLLAKISSQLLPTHPFSSSSCSTYGLSIKWFRYCMLPMLLADRLYSIF